MTDETQSVWLDFSGSETLSEALPETLLAIVMHGFEYAYMRGVRTGIDETREAFGYLAPKRGNA